MEGHGAEVTWTWGAPWLVLDRETDGEEGEEFQPFERRKYPPPSFDFGVLTAFKVGMIIGAPMALVATLFAGYLNGKLDTFRAEVRNDMAVVVERAIDKHVAAEKETYAIQADLSALKSEVDELKTKTSDIDRQIRDIDKIMARLVTRTGIK